MKQKGEAAGNREGVQPNANDLNLVQATGAFGVAGKSGIVTEKLFGILKQKISRNQRGYKQDAEENPDKHKNVHPIRISSKELPGKIQKIFAHAAARLPLSDLGTLKFAACVTVDSGENRAENYYVFTRCHLLDGSGETRGG